MAEGQEEGILTAKYEIHGRRMGDEAEELRREEFNTEGTEGAEKRKNWYRALPRIGLFFPRGNETRNRPILGRNRPQRLDKRLAARILR